MTVYVQPPFMEKHLFIYIMCLTIQHVYYVFEFDVANIVHIYVRGLKTVCITLCPVCTYI